MPRQLPSVLLTLICDDIREEINKKLTFVGVYTGHTIVTEQLPLRLHRMAVYQQLEKVEGEHSVTLRIIDPDGTEIVKTGEWKINVPKGPEGLMDLNVIFGGAKFDKEGQYKIETLFDEEKISDYGFKVRRDKVAS